MNKDSTLTGRNFFQPSGKVNWVRFIPWAALAWIVSVAGAVLLHFLFKWGFYFVIFVPLLLSLAVGGVVFLAVQRGHCRSRFSAGLFGVLAGTTLYLGYYYVGMVSAVGLENADKFEFL